MLAPEVNEALESSQPAGLATTVVTHTQQLMANALEIKQSVKAAAAAV